MDPMSVRDEKLFKILEKLRDHYQNNLNNRYIRKALLLMKVPSGTWHALERLTEKNDFYKIQGYQYKELYEQVYAAATFVYHARTDVMPRLKGLLSGGAETVFSRPKSAEPKDRVLLEMAINNFPANLGVFSDLVNELYVRAAELDREEHPGQKPVYEHMPELKELGKLLT
jgi:hypothetical protein